MAFPGRCVDFIIKLGGSAVTLKNNEETEIADHVAITNVAQLLKKCIDKRLRFVVVHGAGSFGHPQAKSYRVNNGFPSKQSSSEADEVKRGFCLTRLSVTKLNRIILEELISAGLPAVGVSPCGSWETSGKCVVRDASDSVGRLLDAGFIPVLHGDCVLDQLQGCRILSGDTIIETLYSTLHPRRVVFLSDVDGIFTKPPGDQGSLLIPKLVVRQDGSIDTKLITSQVEQDVTGGIELKVKAAINLVLQSQGSVRVYVCAIQSRAAEHACLIGHLNGSRGTMIVMEDTKS